MIILMLIRLCVIGETATACPSVCTCDSNIKILSCHGWKDTSPPNVSNPDRYESLDLSSDNGARYHGAECIDSTQPKARAGVSLPSEGEGAGGDMLLGDALEAGRLPASWLGVGRFLYLKRLRIRGAGLRLVHKDAFRYQLKLRCVDLSRNYMQRLNLFTWQRHDELQSLILAGNKGLRISVDSPILYSKSLRILDLSECQLESLHFCAFNGLPRLKKLDLSNNNLKSISSSTAFPRGLIHLNLSWNNMTYLSSEIAESIMNISEVMLNNNPWKCDCHLMETWKWIRNLTSEETFELLCYANRSWNEVFENETCENFENAVPTIITTEDGITASLDTVDPAEETEGNSDDATTEDTTEEIIYRGEVFETSYYQVVGGIIVTIVILSSQLLLLYLSTCSIWRGRRVPMSLRSEDHEMR